MNKMNKKTLILLGIIILVLLICGAWQLGLIIVGVIALIYALSLIKNELAPIGPSNNRSRDIKLDMLGIDEHDKEIKHRDDYYERKRRDERSIKMGKKTKKKSHNASSSSNRNVVRNSNNERVINTSVKHESHEVHKKKKNENILKGFKLTGLEKTVIVVFLIFAVIVIGFILKLSLDQVNSDFEVEKKDELVMTDAERQANKDKKAKEEEERKKAKEEKEKEEEEKKKAEEEAKEKEKEEKNETSGGNNTGSGEQKPFTPIDESIGTDSPVKQDVYQD